VKRALLAGVVGVLVVSPVAAHAQHYDGDAIVIVIDGASLPDLLAMRELRSLASAGGGALMNGPAEVRDFFQDVLDRGGGRVARPRGLTYHDLGRMDPAGAAADLSTALLDASDLVLAIIVSTSPCAAAAAGGDELGAK